MNNQELYNLILEDIRKISSLSTISYEDEEYKAKIFMRGEKWIIKADTLQQLREEITEFIYG